MKGLNDLKQFVEKELHARRFLTEALEDIKEMEDLSVLKARLNRSISLDKQKADEAAKELKEAKEELFKAKQEISDAKTQAAKIVDDAKEKAKETEADAKEKAKETEVKAKTEAERIDFEAKKQKTVLLNIINDVEAAQKTLDNIKDEQAKLLKKFGS